MRTCCHSPSRIFKWTTHPRWDEFVTNKSKMYQSRRVFNALAVWRLVTKRPVTCGVGFASSGMLCTLRPDRNQAQKRKTYHHRTSLIHPPPHSENLSNISPMSTKALTADQLVFYNQLPPKLQPGYVQSLGKDPPHNVSSVHCLQLKESALSSIQSRLLEASSTLTRGKQMWVPSYPLALFGPPSSLSSLFSRNE